MLIIVLSPKKISCEHLFPHPQESNGRSLKHCQPLNLMLPFISFSIRSYRRPLQLWLGQLPLAFPGPTPTFDLIYCNNTVPNYKYN